MSSGIVSYCHNPRCMNYNEPFLLHQEKETGAWVPDSCPHCGEDFYPDEEEEPE